MAIIQRSLVTVLAVVCICYSAAGQPDILEEEGSGSAIVLLSIARIEQSGVFSDDNGLLRRIAYVETEDGIADNTYREGYHGGIWAVSESAFQDTQDTVAHPRLPARLQRIREQFQIDWSLVQWNDLRKPFYSALAARLVLYNAPEAIPSTSDIEGQAEFWAQYYHQSGSTADFVATASEIEGRVLQSAANEFFIGFTGNVNTPTQQLFVTTVEPTPVNFFVETLTGDNITGTATRNTTVVITLPSSIQVFSSTERNKGIHVQAEDGKLIVVYGLNYNMFSSDAFLALPCARIVVDEYEYYAITYADSAVRPSTILLVGCEDNTTISSATFGTVSLNKQETYLIEDNGDLTGTRVVANKPTSVFSGHICTNVPSDTGACDHLTEQVPPTASWGSFFLVASLFGRTSGEIYRIIAAQNSTEVVVYCSTLAQPLTYTLNSAGNWQEIQLDTDTFCSIESNSAVLIMQFALGNGVDGVGDPFMTMIPPVEQYSNNYVLTVLPANDFSASYITVAVTPQYYQPEQIFVDSFSLEDANWTTTYCSNGIACGHITRMAIQPGEHQLYHEATNAKLGVTVYGFNRFNSYGYIGGLQLIPVQLATVSFSEVTYTVLEDAPSRLLEIPIVRSGNTDIPAVVLVAIDRFRGTATAGKISDKDPTIDYRSESTAEILEFQPGQTMKEFAVLIEPDRIVEDDESFELYLRAGVGVHLAPFSRATVTIVNDDGVAYLSPRYGNMLGGVPVVVTGPSYFGIEEEDNITCVFDDIEVNGIYVDSTSVLCVSPLLSRTGRVPFRLIVSGTNGFTGEATFTSLSVTQAFEVYIDNDDLTFSTGTPIKVYWSSESILPMVPQDSYTVDIRLFELNVETDTWNELVVLGRNIPNSGFTEVVVPDLEPVDSLNGSLSPIVVQVSVSTDSTDVESSSPAPQKRQALSNILRKLGRFALRTLKNSPIRYVKKLARQATQRALCELWGSLQPNNIGQEIISRLPPCPRTSTQARTPNSGFKEERLSSLVPAVGSIQEFFGTTLIDDQFQEYFHPDTTSCFRQIVTDRSQTGGSGQQCCYDRNRNLITGSPGGGTVDLVSPDVSVVGHFLNDVLPFWLCCKAGIFSDCDEYYEHRPSDDRGQFDPPIPACFYGDPHIVTLDGHKYTFNGKGEFTLIETSDESFTLQGRMVEATNTNGTNAHATVFSAIVGRQSDSDKVQFELNSNASITALVNGEAVDFSDLIEQEYNNVTVSDLGNSTIAATFSSGIYLQAKEENGIMSVLIVSLPAHFRNTSTRGLMGSFNGDTSDDLLPQAGVEPLPLDSTLQVIHEFFGLTWIVDTPQDSLFTYNPGESWDTYYDPFFVPVYQPSFTDPQLEARANDICGEDIFCLFDIAATGREDIGISTLEGGQEFEEIVQLSLPVICDPSCESGACIANDTCNCAAGYEGERCSEPVFTECEENPCMNGGSCRKHVLEYICDCLAGFSGIFCEIAPPSTTSPSDPESSNTAAIIGGAVAGVFLICVTIIIIIVIIVCLRRRKPFMMRTDQPVRWSEVAKSDGPNVAKRESEAYVVVKRRPPVPPQEYEIPTTDCVAYGNHAARQTAVRPQDVVYEPVTF